MSVIAIISLDNNFTLQLKIVKFKNLFINLSFLLE